MISYVTGTVESIEKDKLIIDHEGIGLGIFVPAGVLGSVGRGENIKLHTYFSVKEDSMQLFGFLEKRELEIFKMLITVSGVGPKGALSILSYLPDNQVALAVISEDEKAITAASGIGKRTAQRVIIELKDKFSEDNFITGAAFDVQESSLMSSVGDEAVEGLTSLGCSQSEAAAAVRKAKEQLGDTDDVEKLLKAALKFIV